MKNFEYLKFISLLFAICISVSAVIMVVDNLVIVVAYSVLAFLFSFEIQYYEVKKYITKQPEQCFKIVFSVIVSSVSAMALICVMLSLFSAILICLIDDRPRSMLLNSLLFIRTLCMPFVALLIQAALIMLVNRSRICTQKKWIKRFSLY